MDRTHQMFALISPRFVCRFFLFRTLLVRCLSWGKKSEKNKTGKTVGGSVSWALLCSSWRVEWKKSERGEKRKICEMKNVPRSNVVVRAAQSGGRREKNDGNLIARRQYGENERKLFGYFYRYENMWTICTQRQAGRRNWNNKIEIT